MLHFTQNHITVAVHHHIPGRTRLRLGAWPDAAALRNAEMLLNRSGLRITANAHSRSVLVRSSVTLDANEIALLLEKALKDEAGLPSISAAVPDTGGMAEAEVERASPLEPFAYLTTEESLERMATAPQGLSREEAGVRLAEHGPNMVPPPQGRAPEEMLRGQLATFPVALLAGSAVLSVLTGGFVDALVTVGVVAVNAAIGFSSENATERLIRRLSMPVEHEAIVLRGGTRHALPSREVVPGDILVLTPNSVVPADARVIVANQLSIDESILTGESLPVHKVARALEAPLASVAERYNLLHAGTVVTGGDGLAIALQIGNRTEMARTREMIGLARPPRPEVEVQLEELARKLGVACIGASSLVFVIGMLRGEPLLAMVKSAIALTVAAIPEGLPAVATTTFALGARAMEREQAYVRALPAIEALASIDIICLDKTGTLTENHMSVQAVAIGENLFHRPKPDGWSACADAGVRVLAEAATLCNEASLAHGTGSATERALLHLAEELALDPDGLQRDEPIRTLHSRNDLRRWMATQHECRTVIKGAPDEVLGFTAEELVDGRLRPIDEARRAEILAVNEALASRGLRVLGIAQSGTQWNVEEPAGAVWLGLAALADPVRPQAGEAIDAFHRAGIRTIMITGDQSATAHAVAEELALSRSGTIPVVEGAALAGLDEESLGDLACRTSVFARAGPSDKLRIVKALQKAGKRVAMIGDGVNDGPALRAASVGVAMGKKGADVAREVADIVIADDDLRALALAIARGRGTGDSVRNAIRYFLSTNLSEMLVMLGESLHGQGELETPMELFWLNLVTDILPGLGLALAEPPGDVMQHPPRAAGAPLFDRSEFGDMGIDGLGISAATLAAHFIALARNGPGVQTRTATFLTLALAQIAYAWTLRDRSGQDPARRRASTQRLETTLAGSGALLSLPLLLPPLRQLLGIGMPGPGTLLSAVLLAGGSFGFAEGRRITASASARALPSPA